MRVCVDCCQSFTSRFGVQLAVPASDCVVVRVRIAERVSLSGSDLFSGDEFDAISVDQCGGERERFADGVDWHVALARALA